MTAYYLSKGSYGHRHIDRAKAELQELADKAATEKKLKVRLSELGHGYFVTIQHPISKIGEVKNIRIFVQGNSKVNALHMALNCEAVQDFILTAKNQGYEPEAFVMASGNVNLAQYDGLITRQN